MRRTLIIAGVIGIAVFFCVTVLFVAARQPSPAIMIRQVKSVQSGRVVTLTVEMTNHTQPAVIFFIRSRSRHAMDQFGKRVPISIPSKIRSSALLSLRP